MGRYLVRLVEVLGLKVDRRIATTKWVWLASTIRQTSEQQVTHPTFLREFAFGGSERVIEIESWRIFSLCAHGLSFILLARSRRRTFDFGSVCLPTSHLESGEPRWKFLIGIMTVFANGALVGCTA